MEVIGPSEPQDVDPPQEPEGASEGSAEIEEPTAPTGEAAAGAWFEAPRQSASIFASGHSLLDQVFGPPDEDGGPLAALARQAQVTHTSLLQNGPGSTALLRQEDIAGQRYPNPPWARFDTLVITERHDLALSIAYERTLQSVGWFVSQMRDAPGSPNDYFLYQSWWYLRDGGPRLATWAAWADYHRAELPLWECVARAVGAQQGVTMRVLPAGLAMSELMTRVGRGALSRVRAEDVFQPDGVHLRDIGHGFAAYVVFASVYHRPARELAWPMPSTPITEGVRASLAALADEVVVGHFARQPEPTVASCREALGEMCRRFGDRCDWVLPQAFPDDVFTRRSR